MNGKEKPKKKRKTVSVTIDEVTYEKFKALVQREGYIRLGDFLRDFIRRYVECNEMGVSWVIDLKSGLIDRKKLCQALSFATKQVGRYLEDFMVGILEQVIANVERRITNRVEQDRYVR